MKYVWRLRWLLACATLFGLGVLVSIITPGGVQETNVGSLFSLVAWVFGGGGLLVVFCVDIDLYRDLAAIWRAKPSTRQRLKVVEENGRVVLVRTTRQRGREVVGSWKTDEAEDAIEAMVKHKATAEQERAEVKAARRMAKRLNRSLNR